MEISQDYAATYSPLMLRPPLTYVLERRQWVGSVSSLDRKAVVQPRGSGFSAQRKVTDGLLKHPEHTLKVGSGREGDGYRSGLASNSSTAGKRINSAGFRRVTALLNVAPKLGSASCRPRRANRGRSPRSSQRWD